MRAYHIDSAMLPRFFADVFIYSLVFVLWVTGVVGLAMQFGFADVVNSNTYPSPLNGAEVFGIAVLTPLVENGLLIGLITGLQKQQLSKHDVALGCGAVAGLLHATMIPFWGLTASVMFYLMTRLFIKYQRYSITTGFIAILFMHVSVNTLGLLSYL